MPVVDLIDLIHKTDLSGNPKIDLPLEAIRARLGYLRDVGLSYLSLDRPSRSLSGEKLKELI